MVKKFELNTDKIDEFAENHPVAYLLIWSVGGVALTMSMCVLAYRYLGRQAGKSAAKELIDAGVHVGYNHS